MTEPGQLDEAHLRQWIGREDVVADVLTLDLARRFAATVGGPEPKDGEVAAPLIHFCLAQPAVPLDMLGPDGHPRRGGFLPPVPLPRRMWAGGEVNFRSDLRVGDTILRRSRIADVTLKQGRTGALCFVTVTHAIEVEGRTTTDEVQTIVYRDAAPASPTSAPPEPAPKGEHVAYVEPTPMMLFRYSAITFNAHRIHYDRPYTMGDEGYPGLVVHGPMQATWLCHLAARVRGRTPRRFTYRGQSPAFDGTTIGVHARSLDNGDLALWTASEGGPVAMSANASW